MSNLNNQIAINWLEQQNERLARLALIIISQQDLKAHYNNQGSTAHISTITDWLAKKAVNCKAAGIAYSIIIGMAECTRKKI